MDLTARTCALCGKAVGGAEPAHAVRDKVVCEECRRLVVATEPLPVLPYAGGAGRGRRGRLRCGHARLARLHGPTRRGRAGAGRADAGDSGGAAGHGGGGYRKGEGGGGRGAGEIGRDKTSRVTEAPHDSAPAQPLD